MYNEALYPPPRPKWPGDYNMKMIAGMNDKIKAMLEKLNQFMSKK